MMSKSFYRNEQSFEEKVNIKNNTIAQNLIREFLAKAKISALPIMTGDPIEYLLYLYFSVKGTKEEAFFNELLDTHNFNYSMSIHNAIYYLLATEQEKDDSIDPLSWPGMINIDESDTKYTLRTKIGTIEVWKASELFSSSPSHYIFDKTLMGQCYERTYDFLRENSQYKAVLSYMPNFFYGGHYHAYLENDEGILDIAANAYYDNKDSANKTLCGKTLAKLDNKQIRRKIKTLKQTIPVNDHQKLLTLAMYYRQKGQ